MNNSDIVVKFLEQKWCHSPRHNIHSDGTSLWSWGWWEMARWVDGVLVIRQGKRYSSLTGKQMGLLIGAVRPELHIDPEWCYAFEETPKRQALMNV